MEIVGPDTLKIDSGRKIKFLGVRIVEKDKALAYLTDKILGKSIIIKTPDGSAAGEDVTPAYVYLKNRIFINAYLLASGLGRPDMAIDHKYKMQFIKKWQNYKSNS
jgi:hypothetical protein